MATEIILLKGAITYDQYMNLLTPYLRGEKQFRKLDCEDVQSGGEPGGVGRFFNFLVTCLRPTGREREVQATIWYDNATAAPEPVAAAPEDEYEAVQQRLMALQPVAIPDPESGIVELAFQRAQTNIQVLTTPHDQVSDESRTLINPEVREIQVYAVVKPMDGDDAPMVLPVLVVQPNGNITIGMPEKVTLKLMAQSFWHLQRYSLSPLQQEKIEASIPYFNFDERSMFEAQIPFSSDQGVFYVTVFRVPGGETSGVITKVPIVPHVWREDKQEYIDADKFVVYSEKLDGVSCDIYTLEELEGRRNILLSLKSCDEDCVSIVYDSKEANIHYKDHPFEFDVSKKGGKRRGRHVKT